MSDPVSSPAGEPTAVPAVQSPPLLLHIPPPVKPKAGRAGIRIADRLALGSGAFGIALGLLLLGTGSGRPMPASVGIVLPTLGAVGIVVYLLLRPFLRALLGAHQRRVQRWREAFVERHPNWSGDPLAAELARLWRKGAYPPTDRIIETCARWGTPEDRRARVISCGVLEVPEVDDYRFEPVIVSPTRFLWRRLWFVPVAVVILTFWLIQRTQVIPIPGQIPLSSFGYLLVMGAVAGVAWVWRTTVRPTYLRLAPGMIQVVQYGLGRQKPVIRSYPNTGGTIAVVGAGGMGKKVLAVTLVRGEQKDEVPLWQMKDSQETAEALWRVLLSTAPTPPLSDEHLLG